MIFRLQRHRDLVKGWIQTPEVKDKTVLIEYRQKIESEMERFKACERELKTKAYSKQGLNKKTKQDQTTKEIDDLSNWTVEIVDILTTQIDACEAEQELLLVGAKKSKKMDSEKTNRLKSIQHSLERHRSNYFIVDFILQS